MGIYVSVNRLIGQMGVGGFEPQRQHNWSLIIPRLSNSDGDTLALSLVGGFLPRHFNEELTVSYGNEVVHYAGKGGFDGGMVAVRDWLDRNTAKVLWDWRLRVHNPSTGSIGLARQYKEQGFVVLFGPNASDSEGNVAPPAGTRRMWKLIGLWPAQVSFAANGLDQTSSGQVIIEVAFRYDKAIADDLEGFPPQPAIPIG